MPSFSVSSAVALSIAATITSSRSSSSSVVRTSSHQIAWRSTRMTCEHLEPAVTAVGAEVPGQLVMEEPGKQMTPHGVVVGGRGRVGVLPVVPVAKQVARATGVGVEQFAIDLHQLPDEDGREPVVGVVHQVRR